MRAMICSANDQVTVTEFSNTTSGSLPNRQMCQRPGHGYGVQQ